MNESREIGHIEQKKKSKKNNKTYNLLDFVVVKKKKKKTQEIRKVRIAKAIRGKVRKKKLTTLKKRIINERKEKKSSLEVIQEVNEDETEEEEAAAVIKNVTQVDLTEEEIKAEGNSSENLCQALEVLNLSENKLTEEINKISSNSVQHSRNFREYCNHFITPDIKRFTEKILKDLFRFQENKFQQNPVKAKANKRYVVGFKEVKKFLVVKRLKLIIIAPDLEKNTEVTSLVNDIKTIANQNKTPYVFSIKRRHIGYLLLKKVPVSVVGIFDYQGTNENVIELIKLVIAERLNYCKSSNN